MRVEGCACLSVWLYAWCDIALRYFMVAFFAIRYVKTTKFSSVGPPAVQVCVGQRVVMCKAVPADPSSLCSSEGVRFFNLALFLSHKHIQLLVSKQKKNFFKRAFTFTQCPGMPSIRT